EAGERLEAPEICLGRVPPPHRTQHAVVARLQRHMEVPGDGGRLTKRTRELVVDVVDLDRGQPETPEPAHRSGLPDEPPHPVAARAVGEAAEVDAREHDLAMSLFDALADLSQDRGRAAAARGSADERDHAELAREAAAVLNADECTYAVEPRVGLNAADRADV